MNKDTRVTNMVSETQAEAPFGMPEPWHVTTSGIVLSDTCKICTSEHGPEEGNLAHIPFRVKQVAAAVGFSNKMQS